MELKIIEAGAEDIKQREGSLEVYTKPENLETTRKRLEERETKVESVSLDWVPKEEITVEEKERDNCIKLFEALDESEAIQEIYSNLKS